jgi:NADPH:quinone reductase-like Zn-dependent oxidoreductase/acyl carrier protein
MSSILRIPIAGPNQDRAMESAQALLNSMTSAGENYFESQVEAAWRGARGSNRWIVAGRTRGELFSALAEYVLDGSCVASGQYRAGSRRVTFVFSGMGPQWAGMGRSLAKALPFYEERIKTIDAMLAEHYGRSVWEHLEEFEPGDQLPTALAQPGNFLIQAALHDLLIDEGIVPDAVIGHSAGEVASAYAAGVYDLAEAARVAVVRGRLQARLAGRGAMLAIGLSVDEAIEAIADLDGVSLAAVNDHSAVTAAGDADQIAQLEERMRDQKVFAKLLRVEVPYHSPVMDEIADELTEQMGFIDPKPAKLPLYSTLSGELSTGEEWGAGYWPRNVRQPVLFAKAVEAAVAAGSNCFIEIAPHPVLAQSIDALTEDGTTVTPLLSRRNDEFETYLEGVGKLALEGVGRPAKTRSADLQAPIRAPQKLWDADRWADIDRTYERANPEARLLGKGLNGPGLGYEIEISTSDHPWLEGHAVIGLGPIVPATMWAEIMALAATEGEDRSVSLVDVTIVQSLPVFTSPAMLWARVQGGTITCYSRPLGDTDSWTLHAVASAGPSVPVSDEPSPEFTPPGGDGIGVDALYSLFRLKGLDYTGAFQNVSKVVLPEHDGTGPMVAWAEVDGVQPFTDGLRSPWVLDAGLQVLIAAARNLGEAMYLPFRLGRVTFHRPMNDGQMVHVRAEVTSGSDSELMGGVKYFDQSGRLLAEIDGIVAVRNTSDDVGRMAYIDRNSYAQQTLDPVEAIERFAPEEEVEDDLDGVGDLYDLPDELADEIGDQTEEQLDEYWLSSGLNGSAPPFDRPVVAPADVPVGTRAHLLYRVANNNRTDDAIAAFDVANQLGALEDTTLTLTCIGHPDQRWLLGMIRAASNALGYRTRLILADDATSAAELERWVATISENEVILDGDGDGDGTERARVHRLEQVNGATLQAVQADRPATDTLSFDLASISKMEVSIEPVPTPGPGEVTIETWSVPLTWKDVGKALGTLGTDSVSTFAGQNLGLGAVGKVVAAGPDQPFAVGDLIGGTIRRPFRRHITLNVTDEYCRPVPQGATPAVMVAMMSPWVTTLAALDDMARIRPGEKVFIQSGAGALGMVLCRHAIDSGCHVVTSVGTEDKVEELRRRFGSAMDDDRSSGRGTLDVVVARGAEIPGALADADHGPFDCILAVVNGEARSLLLAQLAGRGRYVDLGKPSGADETQLALSVDGNRSFTRVDIDQIAANHRPWFDDLVDRAMAKFTDPSNQLPITRHPIDELTTAIGQLGRGLSTSSLVIDLEPLPDFSDVRRSRPVMDPDGIYLITGGYGAVGLMCAQWMASRGARTIVVTGRSGRVTEQSQAQIDMIRAFGADIWVVAADVSQNQATVDLLNELRQDGPIRGIIHAAAVIADGPFEEIDDERIRVSFGAKVDGAYNLLDGLDQIENGWDDLDFMLFTSSIVGSLGVAIQATYAAANTELDGIATALQKRGVQACAMQLGPIDEGGMAADEKVQRFYAAAGLSMVSPRRLYSILDVAATTHAPEFMTAEFDWRRVGRAGAGSAAASLFRHIVAEATAGGDGAGIEELMMLDVDDRAEVLSIAALGLFKEALGVEDDSVDGETSFADMGIDSLALVEIQVGMSDILQTEVPLARLFSPEGNINQLATRIAEYLEETVIDLPEDDSAATAGAA